MDEVFQATTMIAAFLLHLDILYSPCQVHHKLFGNPFDSASIIAPIICITPGILFLQMCQMHSWHLWGQLVALEFPQREKNWQPMVLEKCQLCESLGPWAAPWNLLFPLLRWPLDSQIKSLPVGLPSGRPPLLLIAWGAYHKSGLSLTLPLDQGESSQGRKQLITSSCHS